MEIMNVILRITVFPTGAPESTKLALFFLHPHLPLPHTLLPVLRKQTTKGGVADIKNDIGVAAASCDSACTME
jgi:hypothetical protein